MFAQTVEYVFACVYVFHHTPRGPQVMVLTHEDATDEEKMPYMGIDAVHADGGI